VITERLAFAGRLAILAVGLTAAACSASSPSAPAPTGHAAATASADPCAAPEASQFDFYVGTWNMSWTEFGPARFTGRDMLVKNGCEIDEVLTAAHFLGSDNYRATSISAWDPARRKWVQQYRDNGGQRTYLGAFENGEMVLTANAGVKQRLTWRDITRDSFVWELDTSADAVNWNQVVVIDYTRS
jgi:hypothetical protein